MPAKKNALIEYFSGDAALTGRVLTGKVTGSTFVALAADTGNQYDADRTFPVATAEAGVHPFGVAGWDRAANDENNPNTVTVFRRGVVSVAAGEALAAGDRIAVGAEGKAVKAAAEAVVVGTALRACAANTGDPVAMVALNI